MFKFEDFVEETKNLRLTEKKQKEVWEEANKRLELFKELGELTEEELSVKLQIITSSMLRKLKRSKGKEFEGIFIADTGVKVKNKWRIDKVLHELENDPIKKNEYLASGQVKMVNDEFVVMDSQKEFTNGNVNPNYGKPLIAQEYRNIITVIKVDGDEKKKILKLKNETLDRKIKIGIIAKFKATEYPQANMLFLDDTSDIEYEEELRIDVMLGILKKHFSKNIIPFQDIEKRLSEIRDNKAEKLVVFKGSIESIGTEKDNPSIKLEVKTNLFLKGEITDEVIDNSNKESELIHVKIPIEKKHDFDGIQHGDMVVIGDLWKIGEDGLLGVTGHGWVCNPKAPKVKPVEDVKTEEVKKEEKDW